MDETVAQLDLSEVLSQYRGAKGGRPVRANASKPKSMTYKRICKEESELAAKVKELLEAAQKADDDEDHKFGKGRDGDELLEELAKAESRRARLIKAKEELEQEARERVAKEAAEQEEKCKAAEALPVWAKARQSRRRASPFLRGAFSPSRNLRPVRHPAELADRPHTG